MKGFSPRAQKLIAVLAQEEGRKRGDRELLPEHVLLALLKSADGLGYVLLQRVRVNLLSFQLALEQSLETTDILPHYLAEVPPSRRLKTMLDAASVESRTFRRDYIGTEHLVLSAVREEQSLAWRYFEQAGIPLDMVRRALGDIYVKMHSSAEVQAAGRGEGRQKGRSVLADFSRDLTALATEGRIDPVVGREPETARVIQVLSRRTKNNPVLVGDPGVGKTAIVEGIAARIASGNVPRGLLKKRLLALDIASVIAGTKYRGEFEERIKLIMKEIAERKDIILFIDELHTIIGAGGSDGALDASNMFKPALSRGEMQCIGAATLVEYRKYVEKDAALERRFQTVLVDEPSDVQTIGILEGIKKKYEEYHGVVYGEGVVEAAVRFSRRYMTDRFLPDKAIDILDEAGAMKKIHGDVRPPELDKLEESINRLTEEKNRLVQDQVYERAAEIRDKVHELRGQLEEFSAYWQQRDPQDSLVVNVGDVRRVISVMTGIPAEQVDSSETEKLLHMEEYLHRSVVGQDEAVRLISSAVRRSRAGISSPKRPAGSFVFLGPTGVGKTQLAKTLAHFLFGSEDSLIRVDMSDYMEKHTASRLVGAPPGYIGYEEGGMLTERIRRNPYSVVLLDEIEKAHPDVFNLLLQVLEEGELRDSMGYTVSFRNTVIIMTSNAGARQISGAGRVGFGFGGTDSLLPHEEIRGNAMNELKKLLSPELLNRIDDIIVFSALSKKEIISILDIQLSDLAERLAEKGLILDIKKSARSYMVENGYDPSFGARPMRRLIQRELEDPLAVLLIEKSPGAGAAVTVSCVRGKLRVTLSSPLPVNEERQETAISINA